jgi:hypothetical protein
VNGGGRDREGLLETIDVIAAGKTNSVCDTQIVPMHSCHNIEERGQKMCN